MGDHKRKMTVDDDQNDALFCKFSLYCKTIECLHANQMLDTVRTNLAGLKQCVLHGPIEDLYPPRNVPDLELWSSWKKHSLILSDANLTADKFRTAALHAYNAMAHNYIYQLTRTTWMQKNCYESAKTRPFPPGDHQWSGATSTLHALPTIEDRKTKR